MRFRIYAAMQIKINAFELNFSYRGSNRHLFEFYFNAESILEI